MKHEADGLYYFDVEMFNREFACAYGRQMYHNTFPNIDRVVLTKASVSKASKSGVNLYWAMDAMYDNGKVTEKELHAFTKPYLRGNRKKAIEMFMDALAGRAKREGLLA